MHVGRRHVYKMEDKFLIDLLTYYKDLICRQTDREQIRSTINNNRCRTFWPRRPLSNAYKTQLTKAYMAETSCISCY